MTQEKQEISPGQIAGMAMTVASITTTVYLTGRFSRPIWT